MRLAELLREATFGVDLTPLSLASVCTVLTSFTGVFVMCGHVNSYAGAKLYYASLFTYVSSCSDVHVSTVLSEAESDVTF